MLQNRLGVTLAHSHEQKHVKACLLILVIRVRGDDARTGCEASWAYRLPGPACASNLVVVVIARPDTIVLRLKIAWI